MARERSGWNRVPVLGSLALAVCILLQPSLTWATVEDTERAKEAVTLGYVVTVQPQVTFDVDWLSSLPVPDLSGLTTILQNVVAGATSSLGNAITTALLGGSTNAIAAALLGGSTNPLTSLLGGSTSTATNAISGVTSVAQNAATAAASAATTAAAQATAAAANAISGTANLVQGLTNGTTTTLADSLQAITAPATGLTYTLSSVASSPQAAVLQTLTQPATALTTALSNVIPGLSSLRGVDVLNP